VTGTSRHNRDGARGVGYKAFWKQYIDDVVHVPDDGELVPIARIDYLNSPNLPEKMKQFILEDNGIKERIKSRTHGFYIVFSSSFSS
jgi:hypothetical protein